MQVIHTVMHISYVSNVTILQKAYVNLFPIIVPCCRETVIYYGDVLVFYSNGGGYGNLFPRVHCIHCSLAIGANWHVCLNKLHILVYTIASTLLIGTMRTSEGNEAISLK